MYSSAIYCYKVLHLHNVTAKYQCCRKFFEQLDNVLERLRTSHITCQSDSKNQVLKKIWMRKNKNLRWSLKSISESVGWSYRILKLLLVGYNIWKKIENIFCWWIYGKQGVVSSLHHPLDNYFKYWFYFFKMQYLLK